MIARRKEDARPPYIEDRAVFDQNKRAVCCDREDELDGKWIALPMDGGSIIDSDPDLQCLIARLKANLMDTEALTFEQFYVDDATSLGGVQWE